MNKDIRNAIIFSIVGTIIVLAIIIPIAVKHNKENEELKNTFSTISNGAKEYTEEKEKAKSHIDEFSYNNATGEVEYTPTITLEMYNRIEEGMTKEDVISILGNKYEILDGTSLYSLVYEKIDASNGYLIAIHMSKENDTVFSKNQEGLE